MITDRGRALLLAHPDRIDNAVLEQFPDFMEFVGPAGPARGKRAPHPTRSKPSLQRRTPCCPPKKPSPSWSVRGRGAGSRAPYTNSRIDPLTREVPTSRLERCSGR